MVVWTLPVPAMSSSSIYTTRKDRRKPIELIVHLLIRRKSTVEKLQFKEASILRGGRQEFVHYCAGREEEEGRKKGEVRRYGGTRTSQLWLWQVLLLLGAGGICGTANTNTNTSHCGCGVVTILSVDGCIELYLCWLWVYRPLHEPRATWTILEKKGFYFKQRMKKNVYNFLVIFG